jgi:hypothetical protein
VTKKCNIVDGASRHQRRDIEARLKAWEEMHAANGRRRCTWLLQRRFAELRQDQSRLNR